MKKLPIYLFVLCFTLPIHARLANAPAAVKPVTKITCKDQKTNTSEKPVPVTSCLKN
ncbi:hypothetical protein [Adhaeribacter terreus]|uniref:Uncharacterized protein n=1 Tax=Adhaeribacter terreus TaxID=529703 RepID=A0ABW0EBT5_9BACT